MASFNKVILMGNLTRDPEMRVTPTGLSICKFTVAVNRKFKMQSGEEREEVAFIDVDTFGKQAETISKFFTKGKPILVEGRLKQDKWEDKNTKEKRSRMKVVLENFQFLGGGRGEGGAPGAEGGEAPRSYAPRASTGGAPAPRQSAPAPQENLDEDVPF